jgi:hypothetical protein
MKFATAFSSPPSSLEKHKKFFNLKTLCEKHTYDPSDGANEFRSGIKIRFGLALVEV